MASDMMRRIDTGIARKASATLRAQGVPAEAALARAGLDAATLSRKNARIPFARHVALLEHAAAAARDPCFGLHLGAALYPHDLGLIGYLGANAATLGDLLRTVARYLPLFTEGTRVELCPSGQHVRVVQHIVDPAGAGSRQVADLGAGGLIRMCRLLTGTMLAPAWIELPFDHCDDELEHRRVLGAPIRTGQPRTAVVLDRKQLALRGVGADSNLFDLLEQVGRERLGAIPDPRDLRAQTESAIVELLPHSTPSLDRVARRLGISSRSLGRKLAEDNTSFKALVDELRHGLARRYLEHGVRPKSIAALLGYKCPSAFHHAFRRWTGTTPAQFVQDARISCDLTGLAPAI